MIYMLNIYDLINEVLTRQTTDHLIKYSFIQIKININNNKLSCYEIKVKQIRIDVSMYQHHL